MSLCEHCGMGELHCDCDIRPPVKSESSSNALLCAGVVLSGEYHADCLLLMGRIETLEWALKDAKGFSEWVEILGRTDCEIYKHELKGNADRSIERIDKALGT